MKTAKRIMSLFLVIALAVPVLTVQKSSSAAAKPKLSKTKITILAGYNDFIKIKNVKSKNIKKVKISGYNKRNVKVSSYKKSKTQYKISGIKKGTTKVIFTLAMKNKKKYILKAKIEVLDPADLVDPTSPDIEYIANRYVEYNSSSEEHRVSFSFWNSAQYCVVGSGKAMIKIVNDDGETVYDNTVDFCEDDFDEWPYDYLNFCYCISKDEIEEGTTSEGTLILSAELDDGTSFDPYEMYIDNLPMVSLNTLVKIQMPNLPLTINDYDYGEDVQYSYSLDDISYNVDSIDNGKCDISLRFSGKKVFDKDGGGSDNYCSIVYKLYEVGSNKVVYSYDLTTEMIGLNESFDNVEDYITDLEPGEYRLEVMNTINR